MIDSCRVGGGGGGLTSVSVVSGEGTALPRLSLPDISFTVFKKSWKGGFLM